jgi:PPOX class probable F420-dependent enzyme
MDAKITEFASEPNFAAFTTLRPDGQPVTQIMWVDADEDHLLINTEKHRRKFRNVQHDPRLTVTIWDRRNPYRYLEVRGVVDEIVEGEAPRQHIDGLSQKYDGKPYDLASVRSERVILRIRPVQVSQKAT